MQLPLVQFKAVGCCLKGFVALMTRDQAAHLHFAGGAQAQVDAPLGQGVEQACRHPRTAHDSCASDAQLGHPGLGAQGGAGRGGIHGV